MNLQKKNEFYNSLKTKKTEIWAIDYFFSFISKFNLNKENISNAQIQKNFDEEYKFFKLSNTSFYRIIFQILKTILKTSNFTFNSNIINSIVYFFVNSVIENCEAEFNLINTFNVKREFIERFGFFLKKEIIDTFFFQISMFNVLNLNEDVAFFPDLGIFQYFKIFSSEPLQIIKIFEDDIIISHFDIEIINELVIYMQEIKNQSTFELNMNNENINQEILKLNQIKIELNDYLFNLLISFEFEPSFFSKNLRRRNYLYQKLEEVLK